jgi:hypothetical protein
MNQAMGHSDYCQLLHRTTHSSSALTEEKFMPKALITAALLASLVCASGSFAAPAAPSSAASAVRGVKAEQPTRMKLQSGADTVKVRAVYSPNVRPNPSTTDDLEAGESGWRSYGMLLATLVLMGVIAVRRYKAGRP